MKAKKQKTNRNQKAVFLIRAKKAFKMFFVPHRHNDYKPHVIRHYGIVALVMIVAGIGIGGNLSGGVLGANTKVTIADLYHQTNDTRKEYGLEVLDLNTSLNKAALSKANDMIANGYWDHVSPSGVEPWKWLDDEGYSYSMAGENLAKNYSTTNSVMAAWMASSGHKENILNSKYKDVGFAVVDGTIDNLPVSLIVAFYGLKASDAAMSQVGGFMSTNFAQIDLLTNMRVMLNTMTPATVASIMLILIVLVVAIMSHRHRHKMPKKLKKTALLRNHAVYKALGLVLLMMGVFIISSVGQIY